MFACVLVVVAAGFVSVPVSVKKTETAKQKPTPRVRVRVSVSVRVIESATVCCCCVRRMCALAKMSQSDCGCGAACHLQQQSGHDVATWRQNNRTPRTDSNNNTQIKVTGVNIAQTHLRRRRQNTLFANNKYKSPVSSVQNFTGTGQNNGDKEKLTRHTTTNQNSQTNYNQTNTKQAYCDRTNIERNKCTEPRNEDRNCNTTHESSQNALGDTRGNNAKQKETRVTAARLQQNSANRHFCSAALYQQYKRQNST